MDTTSELNGPAQEHAPKHGMCGHPAGEQFGQIMAATFFPAWKTEVPEVILNKIADYDTQAILRQCHRYAALHTERRRRFQHLRLGYSYEVEMAMYHLLNAVEENVEKEMAVAEAEKANAAAEKANAAAEKAHFKPLQDLYDKLPVAKPLDPDRRRVINSRKRSRGINEVVTVID